MTFSGHPMSTTTTNLPRDIDIIIQGGGRGKQWDKMAGTQRLRHVCREFSQDYHEASTKKDKTEIVFAVIRQLSDEGRRFFRLVPQRGSNHKKVFHFDELDMTHPNLKVIASLKQRIRDAGRDHAQHAAVARAIVLGNVRRRASPNHLDLKIAESDRSFQKAAWKTTVVPPAPCRRRLVTKVVVSAATKSPSPAIVTGRLHPTTPTPAVSSLTAPPPPTRRSRHARLCPSVMLLEINKPKHDCAESCFSLLDARAQLQHPPVMNEKYNEDDFLQLLENLCSNPLE